MFLVSEISFGLVLNLKICFKCEIRNSNWFRIMWLNWIKLLVAMKNVLI